MKVVEVNKFMDYLQENGLVIVPAKRVGKDVRAMQSALVKKSVVTYKEIAESGIWGQISQKRAYQIALDKSKGNELIRVGGANNSKHKMVISGVVRVAKERGTYLL